MSAIQTIESISEVMRRLELPAPLHPLVALIDYNQVEVSLNDAGMRYALGFYKVSFKTGFKGQVKYGPGYYDFEEGGMAFLSPGQVVTMNDERSSYEGYSIFFHPDLIRPYPLGRHIQQYGFFSYRVSEALYLSEKEKAIISGLFATIETELQTSIDQFSQDVLVSQLELLLNYSNRFYHRQFLTRRTVYNDVIARLDEYLRQRLDKESALEGVPTVAEVSEYLGLSMHNLTDMLKSLTGQNTQQHIHNRLIEKAKEVLVSSELSIAEIAYELGFEHPQSFNRLFKQKTNVSPVEYRQGFK